MATSSLRRTRLPRKPQLVIVNGDKGGVGKSFTCNVIVSRMLAKGLTVIGVDGDARNGHFDRFYSRLIRVARHDLRSEEGWSATYDLLDSIDPAAAVIVDLPAGAGQRMTQELQRFLLAVDELGRRSTHIWVAGPGEDSVRLFREQRGLASPIDTIFVRNCVAAGDEGRFSIWDGSKTRTEFVAAGGVDADLPHLSTSIVTAFAEAHAPFSDPAAAALRRSQRLSFAIWSASVDQKLEVVLNTLLGGDQND